MARILFQRPGRANPETNVASLGRFFADDFSVCRSLNIRVWIERAALGPERGLPRQKAWKGLLEEKPFAKALIELANRGRRGRDADRPVSRLA